MCGILVALSLNKPINHAHFDEARDSMRHRGPDAAGSVFFQNSKVAIGHRRLSIMDLSDSANQPMQLGDLWLSYNGEIYNYPELRRELEKLGCCFKTQSDTEVLLHGFKVWGQKLCDHLSGMFAFAIWDCEKRKLFLGRDHIGQKPLYFSQSHGQFIVASEIKAITALIGQRPRIRKEAILDHIIYDFVPEPYTWYEDVHCVRPGHQLMVTEHFNYFECEESQYWTFTPPSSPSPLSKEDALDLMGEEIEKAVKSHLMADVEVGAFLSGGVDSSCVVALTSQFVNHPVRTFSVGFGSSDEDELPLARETAHAVGALHAEGQVSEKDFGTSMDDILQMFDQPFADSSLVPTLRVAELAAKDVKVVLTGDGGDEAFGGYNLGKYISPALDNNVWRNASLSRGGIKSLLIHFYESAYFHLLGPEFWYAREKQPRFVNSTKRFCGLFGADLAASLKDYDHKWVYEAGKVDGLDPFRQAQWHHLKFILPGKMLVKVDRCSMYHSLEARSPFLSHTLLETMFSMPTAVSNPDEDWYKGLFRQWAADKIPQNVINAPKRGFGAPGGWSPFASGKAGVEVLSHCIDASYVSPKAWPEIKRKPRLFWKFLQVERALEMGVI